MIKVFDIRKFNRSNKEVEGHKSRNASDAITQMLTWLNEDDCMYVTLRYPSKATRSPYGPARDGQVRCNILNGWTRINHSWHPTMPEELQRDRKLDRLIESNDKDAIKARINRTMELRDRNTLNTYQKFRKLMPHGKVHICSLFASHDEQECAMASDNGKAVTAGISRR